jgi:hypothetical protein
MPGSSSETLGRFYYDLGSNIVVQCTSVPIFTLHGRTTARAYMYVDRLSNHDQEVISEQIYNKTMPHSRSWKCSVMVLKT